jgi:trigger factor
MQVSVEKLGDLERRITVQVPAEQIDPEVQNRLKSLSPRVKLHGFRPGKVPFKMVKQIYGPQVRDEVVSEVLRNSYQDAVTQEKLRPVGVPRIEPKSIREGEDLEYSATFEILPEFEVTGTDVLKVERPTAEVTEADIDAMLETLRKQRITWNSVERPAQWEDRVMLNFEGKLDGQDFPNNKGENTPLVLGSGNMPRDFEEHLIGLQAGAQTEFEITFPENYRGEHLAGKTVHFSVKVTAVEEPYLPELNEEFAATFDLKEDGIDGLRQAVRENMERELGETIKTIVKRQLMESLLATNDIPVPQAMVKGQIEHMAKQAGFPDTDDEKAATLKSELFAKEARRRIALGLILSRLAEANHIELDEARVRSHLAAIASTYQEPEAVVQWYEKNPPAIENIRTLALEDQVVDWLLERTEVTDKPSSFDEIMKPKAGSTTVEE